MRQNSPAEAPLTENKHLAGLQAIDKQQPRQSGIGLIVLMLVIVAATLASEDLAGIGAGLMIARGALGFLPGVLACLFGIYFGDLLLFWAGRIFRRAALKHRPLRWFIVSSGQSGDT